LQLVQALKFEVKSTQLQNSERRPLQSQNSSVHSAHPLSAASEEDSGLADFLIERAAKNAVLGTVFHWYLMVECEDKVVGKMYARVAFQFMQRLVEVSRKFSEATNTDVRSWRTVLSAGIHSNAKAR
jgi:phosphatidylinositol 3-kinase